MIKQRKHICFILVKPKTSPTHHSAERWGLSLIPGHMVDKSLRSVLREQVGPKLFITADTRPSVFCWSACQRENKGCCNLHYTDIKFGLWDIFIIMVILPMSLKMRCSSSFTVAPGNIGRPVAISYRIQPTPLGEEWGDVVEHIETPGEVLFQQTCHASKSADHKCKHVRSEWAQSSLLFHPGWRVEEVPCGLMRGYVARWAHERLLCCYWVTALSPWQTTNEQERIRIATCK